MKEIVPLDYCRETIDLKKTIESGFIVLGERLSKIKDAEMWQSQWSSFPEYLAEMNINESTASKLISVHKLYVERFSIDESILVDVGYDKLYTVKELVEQAGSKESAEDIVRQVSVLKREDTREMVREHRNGECHHEWIEIHLRACKVCGKKEKIHG